MSEHDGRQRRGRLATRWLVLFLIAIGSGLVMGSAQTGQYEYVVPVREASQRAIEQLTLAIRVSLYAPVALTMPEMKRYAAQVLNILVGEKSEYYQRDTPNAPGTDSFGVIPRIQLIRTALTPSAQNNNAQAQSMLNALEGIEFFLTVSREELSAALKNQDERQVRFVLRRLFAFLSTARGSREDPLTEGGTRALNAQVDRP